MAYINLTGDSNGDLHNAEMHNAKFGAIASVLNGNIDADNLAAPQSLLTWEISNGFTERSDGTDNTNDMLRVSNSDSTSGILNVANFAVVQTTDAFYLLTHSLRKAHANMTLVGVSALVYQQPGTVTGNTFSLIFQKSSTITGTYSNMATGTFNRNTLLSAVTPNEITMNINNATIGANQYFRVLMGMPSTFPGSYGPDFPVVKITLTFKAFHTA
tara:strand:- start:7404 stop:8048 length:645 start_codon:yes stop_codon:yes gene_type:complete